MNTRGSPRPRSRRRRHQVPRSRCTPHGKQHGGAPKDAPSFPLKRVNAPGTASLTDYADQPLVLAFFSSDLVFDIHGETCPGWVTSLLTLQRLTAGGTPPRVLALQGGDEGKPGSPLIPRGLHLNVANDPNSDVQHAYGLD